MRYLILSDLHANLQALDAVLADADRLGYDRVLVLGDLVGYGGDPSAVIARTLALGATAIIRGNHDKVCAGLAPAGEFNDAARYSIEWTAEVLAPDELAALAALPAGPRLVAPGLEICHGAPFDEDFYVFTAADAERAAASASAPLCFFGHTHLPVVYAAAPVDGLAGADPDDDRYRLPDAGAVLVNVGSVGQPRDGDPRAAYGLFDEGRRTLRLRRVAYDVAAAQARIVAAGLPRWLAERLALGQ